MADNSFSHLYTHNFPFRTRISKCFLLPTLSFLCTYVICSLFFLRDHPEAIYGSQGLHWFLFQSETIPAVLPFFVFLFFLFVLNIFSYRPYFSIIDFSLSCIFGGLFYVGFFQQISSNTCFSFQGTMFEQLLFFFIFLFLSYIFIWCLNITTNLLEISFRKKSVQIGRIYRILVFLLLLVMWFPHVIANFPGSVCSDTHSQLSQFLGFQQLSNNNPVFDTMVYGWLFIIGEFIGKSANAGISAIIISQFVLYLFVFTYTIETVVLISNSTKVGIALALFYGIIPMFGGAIQIVMKDSFHLPMTLLYLSILIRTIYLNKKPTLWQYSLCFLLASLTRKAAFAYVLFGGFSILLHNRRNGISNRKWIAVILLCASFLLCFENIFLPATHVIEAPKKENYSLPLQIISYIVNKHYKELSEDEIQIIDALSDVNIILSEYNPNLADPMKNSFHGNAKNLTTTLLTLTRKFPIDSIKAVLTSCWKYYFPFSSGNAPYRSYIADFKDLNRDVHYVFPNLHNVANQYAHLWEIAPFFSLLIGPGLYSWIILFLFAKGIRRKNYVFLSLLMIYGILLIGFLFTPVNGETRYAYPLISATPVLLILSNCNIQSFSFQK